MNEFVTSTINKSGMTISDVARKMDVTPQAVHNLIKTAEPRPSTLVKFLSAIGWSMADIAALPLSAVYELAAPSD